MRTKFSVAFSKTTVNVLITNTDEYGNNLTSEELRDAAIDKAVKKHYGKNCFWSSNSGVGWDCGQVFKALRPTKYDSNPGSSSVTSQICLDVYMNGHRV